MIRSNGNSGWGMGNRKIWICARSVTRAAPKEAQWPTINEDKIRTVESLICLHDIRRSQITREENLEENDVGRWSRGSRRARKEYPLRVVR